MSTETTILDVLNEHGGELLGTEALAIETRTRRKSYLLKWIRLMQQRGLISVVPSPGGRGRKTHYKINRNSPGAPRKGK